MRAHLPATIVLLLTIGCARAAAEGDFESLGLVGASSEPPPGVFMPVQVTDLTAISERGRVIARMERTLRLAYEGGLSRISGDADVVLPLVDVDPGGKSAQVVFVRWTGPNAKSLQIADARRWVLVSILLDPDRVLDVELLDGPVEAGSHEARRIRSLLAAARHMSKAAPGDLFHLLDLYERFDPSDAKSKTVARVYALSADGDGPDVEVVVDEIKKKDEPVVLSDRLIHARGKGVASPIVTDTAAPTPVTVARAMLTGGDVGEVMVLTSDDATWTISAADGRIVAPK